MYLRNKPIGQIKTASASHGFLQKYPTAHVAIIVISRDIHMSLSISQRRMFGIPWESHVVKRQEDFQCNCGGELRPYSPFINHLTRTDY